jgi:hypothetical protein
MARASYLTVAQQFDLQHACRAAQAAFEDLGYGVFQVGSSLIRANWRDVDVRALLADDKFDALFVGNPARLAFLNVAVSEWLQARTGLPVDFQFQRTSDANREFDGPRNFIAPPLRTE